MIGKENVSSKKRKGESFLSNESNLITISDEIGKDNYLFLLPNLFVLATISW
jgi:hypothetical protein